MLTKKKPMEIVCSDEKLPTDTDVAGVEEDKFSLSSPNESEILRQRSQGTLNSEFFDSLWPLILRENICEIKSKHTKIFQPYQKFDEIWVHTYLAERGFKKYEKPTELRCFKEKKPEEEVQKRRITKCPIVCRPKIQNVAEQVAEYQKDTWRGQHFSYKFLTRIRPWYTTMSIFDPDFEITKEMLEPITCPFDLAIVEKIKEFDIKVLIVDCGTDIPLKNMLYWIPFSKFVKIVVVSHNKLITKYLKHVRNVYEILDFEEDMDETWQSELDRSLAMAHLFAYKKGFLDPITKEFIFAFSKARALCVIDSFVTLTKDIDDIENYFDKPLPTSVDPCGCPFVIEQQSSSSQPDENEIKAKCYDRPEENLENEN